MCSGGEIYIRYDAPKKEGCSKGQCADNFDRFMIFWPIQS